MAPSDRLTWPPQGSLRAYVDLSIAHWRVASYLRGAPHDEPESDPPADAVAPDDGPRGVGDPPPRP